MAIEFPEMSKCLSQELGKFYHVLTAVTMAGIDQ